MEDQMTSDTQSNTDDQQSAQSSYALCEIPIDHIVVSQNNPRKHFDQQELERLAHAIKTRGFDHPLLVKPTDRDGYYELVDGERRWRAAQLAEVEVAPALVKAQPEAPGADLLDAMLANGLGVSLDLLEEALGYQTLISDHGYTRKGISEAFKVPLARVRERLLILDLPEQLRLQVAEGTVPVMAVKTLAALAQIHADLAAVAARRVLDGPFHEWDEPTSWEDLVADPISVLIGEYDEQLKDLPDDVFVAGASYPIAQFELEETASANLAKLCEFLSCEPEQFSVRFDRELLDQALALNAAHRSANKTEAIIVGADVACQLAADSIQTALKDQRAQAREAREHAKQASSQGIAEGAPDDDGEGDGEPLSDVEMKAAKLAASEASRELRTDTITKNQRLGTTLLNNLAKVKIDERVLKILTAAPLAGDLGKIAARGARLAFPGWADLTTLKNKSIKAEYPNHQQTEAKAREYLAGANTASEIAGRTLALLAAARWANEDNAIAMTHASNYSLRFASYIGEHGVPWGEEVEDLLDEILIEKLPTDVSDPIKEAKEDREAKRAEEERRERERDTVVAAFTERAPSLTCDERQEEIQRLRSEYGFLAVPAEAGRRLMELPEPGAPEEPADAPQGEDAPEAHAEVALAA
jgi:ParB/RepB/Spo0J family partition protein